MCAPVEPEAVCLQTEGCKGCLFSVIRLQVGGSIGLFSLMTMGSFVMLAPVAFLIEGTVFLPSTMKALGVTNVPLMIKSATLAALTFHLYQQVSYMILARVSPVTHSIGNCVKRYVFYACIYGCFVLSIHSMDTPMRAHTHVRPPVLYSANFKNGCNKSATNDRRKMAKEGGSVPLKWFCYTSCVFNCEFALHHPLFVSFMYRFYCEKR
jgi:hypothetical protein